MIILQVYFDAFVLSKQQPQIQIRNETTQNNFYTDKVFFFLNKLRD